MSKTSQMSEQRAAAYRASGMNDTQIQSMLRIDVYYDLRRDGMSEDDARRAAWPED